MTALLLFLAGLYGPWDGDVVAWGRRPDRPPAQRGAYFLGLGVHLLAFLWLVAWAVFGRRTFADWPGG
jgi:hypothetical protein